MEQRVELIEKGVEHSSINFFLQSILILRKEGIFTVVCFCIHYYFHHDHADFHCCFKEGQPPRMGYWE